MMLRLDCEPGRLACECPQWELQPDREDVRAGILASVNPSGPSIHMKTVRLRVEVEDGSIIVTLPGTSFRVIYRKPSQYPGFLAFDLRGDKDAEFH